MMFQKFYANAVGVIKDFLKRFTSNRDNDNDDIFGHPYAIL